MKWISILALLLIPQPLLAQVSEEEHLSHHPEQQAEQPTSKPKEEAGGTEGVGGMMGNMGNMMEKMGVPPPKDTYPSLMDMPELPLEKRAEFEEEAHVRMQAGAAVMVEAITRLTKVASGSDFAEMQGATVRLREGLAQFESGLAAHRALREGQPPRNVALQWFKKEMNLTEPQQAATGGHGVLGLGWFHAIAMVLLVAFAVLMVWMYFHKMRRASLLVEELTAQAKAATPQAPSAVVETAIPSAASQPATVAPSSLPPVEGKWSGDLKVALSREETPEVRTLRLVEPGGGPIPFVFRPGQFATLSVAVDGKNHKRCYTIASSPTQRDYVELTVKGEPDGAVSKHLCEAIKAGDSLSIAAPSGAFTFDGSECDSVVLIGGGVGITPLMSALRYLTDRVWPGEIVLLYSCRTSSLFVFREELEFLQHRHANLKVIATMTRDPGTDWMGLQGHITRAMIESSVPDIANRRIHLCGPPPMMDALNAILSELQVAPENIKTEAFGPAARPKAPRERPKPVPQTGFEVAFRTSGKQGKLGEGQTVLDVADELGVDIENSCRVGTCGSCKVRLVSGAVHQECEDGLDPGDKESGMVLACQAEADSDLVVEE